MTQTLTTQFATAGAMKEFYDKQLLDNLYCGIQPLGTFKE